MVQNERHIERAPVVDRVTESERSIGEIVKDLRTRQGLSLQELSKLAGVSVGMLSQIERNLANPSIRVLTAIRRALDAPVGAFFQGASPVASDPEFVRRAGRRPSLKLGPVSKELLSSSAAHNLQVMILHVDPEGSSGDVPVSYAAEKGGMVLSGQIVLKVGDKEAVLEEGDSFVFDSSIPHSFRNDSRKVAKVLWIIGAVPLERHL